ncbi:MAG: DUF3846 domain-containing protein [Erysipelotrichaceae bacterium]|nr:DUF3846 domain-containing protein [Erysipelotrichaceae bacterium]
MINAVQVNVNERPKVISIEDDLDEYQRIVGGFIDFIQIDDDEDVNVIINDEGKLMGLDINKLIYHNNDLIDVLVGNLLVVGVDNLTGNVVDLPKEKIDYYMNYFDSPYIRI